MVDWLETTQLELWEVYALANPEKTPAQVKAWRGRHCPDA
jgi:hypothetical protein